MRRSLTLIILFIQFCMAYADNSVGSLPAELRWTPSQIMEIIQKDSIDTEGNAGETLEIKRIDEQKDTIDNRNWWYLLKKGKLAMNDTTVEWPRFLGFCVKVYNWADHVFSSTDTTYVVGTGKRWRARVINDNWNDSYYIRFTPELNSIMSGVMHILAGPSIQYMAVSYAYMFDISHYLGGGPINYRKQEFSFNCARFAAEGYYYSNKAGTYIRTFGDYNNHRPFKMEFSGIGMTTFGVDAYYFLNGYKYSQAAAYGFSKFQKKSQGCWMVGIAYCDQDISVNLGQLPEELKPYAEDAEKYYKFHYHDYNVLGGYGYNCVLSPHWLYNITIIPGIGFNHCYEDSQEASAKLLSISARGMTSFTYNAGNWFAGIQGKVRGNWYHSKNYSLFNAIENVILSAGYRF